MLSILMKYCYCVILYYFKVKDVNRYMFINFVKEIGDFFSCFDNFCY